jgi:hypothetical protein
MSTFFAIRVKHRANGQALQQRAPRNIRGKFIDGNSGLDVPDVGLRQHQSIERDVT